MLATLISFACPSRGGAPTFQWPAYSQDAQPNTIGHTFIAVIDKPDHLRPFLVLLDLLFSVAATSTHAIKHFMDSAMFACPSHSHPVFTMTRFTVIGLENGQKRTLVWLNGELIGDSDLKERFQTAWNLVDHQDFREKLEKGKQEYWIPILAEKLLKPLFAEMLDFEKGWVSSPEKLQQWADAWNAHENPIGLLADRLLKTPLIKILDFAHHHLSAPNQLRDWVNRWNFHGKGPYAAEDMRQIEEDQNWRNHHGPPFSWEEIETVLSDNPASADHPPRDNPKCLDCLQPMEWIYFQSSSKTWEMLCGSAGWTPICKNCKTWRACRVDRMN